MKKNVILFIVSTILLLSCAFDTVKPKMQAVLNTVDEDQFKIVAYLPKYTTSLADHLNAFDFTKITHLNVAFFNPDANGSFPAWMGIGLDQLVTKAHEHNVKILLSLAGGGNFESHYETLLQEPNREAFIDSVVALVSLYNVDGIDVDLEGDRIDANYEAFVTGLSAHLAPSDKLLTAAVAWWTRDRISDAALEAFDFINVMAYDQAGAEHAPYNYAKQHLDYWKGTRGLPAAKVVIGVPFYGYYKVGSTLNSMTYKDIIATYAGAQLQDSFVRSDGYLVNYNGIPTIQNKTAFSLANGGGIMFWQVLQDDSGSASLLQAIHHKMSVDSGWQDPYITWKYLLNTGTGNGGNVFGELALVPNISVATKGMPGFLPYPPYGSARLSVPAGSGASFELLGSGEDAKLKAVAAAGGAPGKFSWYHIEEATTVSTFAFDVRLDATRTNGQIIIPFGYSTDASSVFNNTNQLTSTYTEGVFGAIRLDFYGGDFATLSYRNASYGYNAINNNVFNKIGNYTVEIFCNNDVQSRSYTKAGLSYTLAPGRYSLWVNGVLIKDSSALSSFPATGEVPLSSALNSFSFHTSGNSGTPGSVPPTAANSLNAIWSNITVDFSF